MHFGYIDFLVTFLILLGALLGSPLNIFYTFSDRNVGNNLALRFKAYVAFLIVSNIKR